MHNTLKRALQLLAAASLASLTFTANAQQSCLPTEYKDQLAAWCEKKLSKPKFNQKNHWKKEFCEELLSNEAPVAEAAGPDLINVHSYFLLDASASTDLDGDHLTYSWSQSAGATAIPVAGLDSPHPEFYAVAGSTGELVFEVSVSDGEETSTAQVVVPVNSCSDDPSAIFTNCTDPSWNGLTGWEILDDGEYTNYMYENGHNDYLINWEILDTGEAGYDQVIDIRYQDKTGVNGLSRIFTSEGPGATTDLSSYYNGTLEFDIRVLNWGETSAMETKLECKYPCESATIQLPLERNDSWQHVSIPISLLADTGLDLTEVEMGFQVFPQWGLMHNVHFQVDNIHWQQGASSGADPLDIDYSAWFANANEGVSVEHYTADETLIFTPSWDSSAEDYAFNVQYVFPETVNLDGGSLSLDLYIPQAEVTSYAIAGVMLFDANWNSITSNLKELDSSVVGTWTDFSFMPFDIDQFSSNEEFDHTNIQSMIVFFHLSDEFQAAEFSLKNLHIVEGDGTIDSPQPGPGELEVEVNAGEGFAWYNEQNELVFNPVWAEDDWNSINIYLATESADLETGSLSAEIYLPASYTNGGGLIQLSVFDNNYNSAITNPINLSGLIGDAWNTVTLADIPNADLVFISDEFNASSIIKGTLFLSMPKDENKLLPTEEFRIRNFSFNQ